jgi:hypothetical protein
MQPRVIAQVLVLIWAVVGAESKSPLLKVFKLLEDLEAKIVAEDKLAKKQFEEYTQWCKGDAKELKYEIKVATDDTDEIKANILKATSDISVFSSKIEELAAAISEDEAELKQAMTMRAKERKEFLATEKELLDSVDTLERATNVLQRKMNGGALLQAKVNRKDIKNLVNTLNEIVNAASLTLHDQKTLMSLAQSDEDDEDYMGGMGAPAAAAYKNQASSSVLDMLEDLKRKAEKQLNELRKEEMIAKQNFESMELSLQDQIDISTREMNGDKEAKSMSSEAKAAAEGELAVTQKDLASDKERLAKVTRDCVVAAEEHDHELKERAAEASTIREAASILKDRLDSSSASSFLQVASSDNDFEVVNILRSLAQKQNSVNLAQMAAKISAAMTRAANGRGMPGHGMIKEMIEKMVSNLEKEGKAESSHKEYCDKELKETQLKKGELGHETEKISAVIDKDQAKSQALRNQIQVLQEELATLAKSSAEADRIRMEAAETYKVEEAGIRSEMKALRTALKVLKEAFQTRKEEPVLFQQQHESRKHATTKIISLMEDIEAEMSKSWAALEEDERIAQSAYEKLKQVSSGARQLKEKDVKLKEKQSASLQKSLTDQESDLDEAQTEMAAVLEYWKNIKATCTVGPDAFANRKERRQAEIDGLQEALKVLSGQAILLQRKVSLRLQGSIDVLR